MVIGTSPAAPTLLVLVLAFVPKWRAKRELPIEA
jgi:hypothetical protein